MFYLSGSLNGSLNILCADKELCVKTHHENSRSCLFCNCLIALPLPLDDFIYIGLREVQALGEVGKQRLMT